MYSSADVPFAVFLPIYLVAIDVLRPNFLGDGHAVRQTQLDFAITVFHGQLGPPKNEDEFEKYLDRAVKKKWVVYVKRPFGDDPERVLKYLARYTDRVAISNYRLIAMRDGRVGR